MARAATYIAILGIYLAAVSAAAGVVATHRIGQRAYLASAAAALLVWIVGSTALALIASARTPMSRLNCSLAAMLVRMALPMGAVVYFTNSQHSLAAQGMAGLIVVHYLAGLLLETFFAVRIVSAASAGESQVGLKSVTVN